MPAHRFDGSTWVEHTAFFGNGGVYTDTNDNFWAWDGAAWKLIQPVAAIPGGGLLPPENLTITELSDFSVEITWDDPNQPGVLVPTHVQYRIPEITSVLTEFAEPVNIFSHNSLIHDTAYTFEVRYIIREAGEIVASSLFAQIPFVTLAVPVGVPAEDPGGTGGQSIIPIRPPVDPGPVGGPGCWWEWELFIWDDDGFGWETTGLTGTHPGTVANFHYDLATLDPTRMYRFEFCENCNGVLSGQCNFGEPFVGLDDWDAVCGGLGPSNSMSFSAAADAAWAIPKICLDASKVMSIFDAISGLEVAPGAAYGFYSYDADGEWQIVSDDTIEGTVFNAPIPAMLTTLASGEDFSIMFRIRLTGAFTPDAGHLQTVWTGGLAHEFKIIWGVASFSIQARFALAGGGTLQLDTDQFPYTPGTYIVVLRWDNDGNKELFVNSFTGGAEDTDASVVPLTTTTIQPVLFASAVPGVTHAMHYGWDRLLTNAELLEIFDEHPAPISFSLVGTPLVAGGPTIPYYGDWDPVTQHLIVGDVYATSCGPYVIDCHTNSPTLLSFAFVPGGYYTARWGVTNATGFYFGNHWSGTGSDGLYPVNTANHSAITVGSRVPAIDMDNFFRHGSKILVSYADGSMQLASITAGIPALTGSPLASAGGQGCGHPLDPDTFYVCQGATLKALNISGASPTVRQSFAPGGGFSVQRCVALGNTLYAHGAGKFHMIDITNRNSAVLLGTLSNANFDGGGAITVEANGQYAYTNNGAAGSLKRIDAIDCRNPTAMSVLASGIFVTGMANPMDMYYDDTGKDRLVIVSQQPNIQIVKINR